MEESTQTHALVIDGFIIQEVELFKHVNEVDLLSVAVTLHYLVVLRVKFYNRLCFIRARLVLRVLGLGLTLTRQLNCFGRKKSVTIICTILRAQKAEVLNPRTPGCPRVNSGV